MHAPAPQKQTNDPIALGIATCCGIFLVVLALSTYWDPAIRVLHVFEAVPYTLAAALCWRRMKFGYALAFAAGAFWLWSAAFLTTFVRNGFERLWLLLTTGRFDRPDILIAIPAALATGGLALFALWGYARLRKDWSDLALFGLALATVVGWFVGIFALFAPRYLGMFKHLWP